MQRLYSSRASRIATRGALSVWQRARGYRYFSSGETLGLLQREEGIYLKARRGNPPVLQYATGQTCRLIERPSGKPWGYAAIVGIETRDIRTTTDSDWHQAGYASHAEMMTDYLQRYASTLRIDYGDDWMYRFYDPLSDGMVAYSDWSMALNHFNRLRAATFTCFVLHLVPVRRMVYAG